MSKEKATQKDAVFDASIEFIKTLTGMEPPPIEIAPPEVLKPFREFTEKVCSIFHNSPPQRTWVGLTDEDCEEITKQTMKEIAEGSNTFSLSGTTIWNAFIRAIETKLKELNT